MSDKTITQEQADLFLKIKQLEADLEEAKSHLEYVKFRDEFIKTLDVPDNVITGAKMVTFDNTMSVKGGTAVIIVFKLNGKEFTFEGIFNKYDPDFITILVKKFRDFINENVGSKLVSYVEAVINSKIGQL